MSLRELYSQVCDAVALDCHLTDMKLELPQHAELIDQQVLGPFALLAAAGEEAGVSIVDDYTALMHRCRRTPPPPFSHGYLVSCLSIKHLNGQPITLVPEEATLALKEFL